MSNPGGSISPNYNERPDIYSCQPNDNDFYRPRHGVALPGNNITFDGNVEPDDQTNEPIQSKQESNQNLNQFSKPVKNSVSVIINQYKSSVKRWWYKNRFDYFQWQTRFYDQILQNKNSIDNVREYIFNNPKNWPEDELYN